MELIQGDEFLEKFRELIQSTSVQSGAKAHKIVDVLEDLFARSWIYCRHLVLILGKLLCGDLVRFMFVKIRCCCADCAMPEQIETVNGTKLYISTTNIQAQLFNIPLFGTLIYTLQRCSAPSTGTSSRRKTTVRTA